MSANAETDNDPQNDAGKDAKGQKGKKNKQKGKTMSLAAFNAQGEQPQVSNWADHVETVSSHRQTSQTASTWQPKQSSKFAEPDSAYDLDIDPIRSQLPTAPRAAREPVALDLSRIPENGPYKVHVGNLPFGVDEVAVANFFGTDEKQVHLIRDSGRPKGFGFVELPSRDLLIAALEKNGELMANRAVKVALATAPTGSENDRHRNDRDDRSNRAWRSDAPREEVERNWRERRSDDRDTERRFDDRDRDRDRGERRFDDRDRDRGGRFDDRDRDRGDRRYDDRDRGGDRRYDDRDRRYDGGRRFNDRRPYDDRDRDRDRRKFDDREEEPRTEESNWRRGLAQRKDEQDGVPESRNERDQDSRKDRSPPVDSAARRGGSPRNASPEHEKPRERPKLNLQPRTKPIDDVGKQSGMSDTARQAIFGAAKPVDTVSREREIEKRLDAEREKFDSAHELDDAVANRTRRRTISSSSNASQTHRPSRSEDAGPERERLNSAKVIEEDDRDRDRPQPARGERTWYRGGAAPRGAGGRYDRGAPRDRDRDRDRDRRPGGQYPERNVPSGNDEYFYDDDYRSEQPQSDHPDGDDETSGYGRRGGQGGPRRRPDDRYAPRGGRGKATDAVTADEDGFQQVGAGGRAVLAVAATRPADYPGGKPTSAAAAQKRTDSGAVKKDEAPLKPASLIHKSKFSALASANFDEDVNASDDE